MPTFLHQLFAWAPLGVPAFLFVITFVVFFHELGHFLVARACGVAVKTFSLGFGSEIVGWTDKKGTRWRISWIPLGGYVMFLGDENAASMPDRSALEQMSEETRKDTIQFKPLWQRALVVVAGPAANFVLAILVFTFLFAVGGLKNLGTYTGPIQAHTPAAEAGFHEGDKIVAVDGKPIRLWGDLRDTIVASKGKPLTLSVLRHGEPLTIRATPRTIPNRDIFGAPTQSIGLGIAPGDETPENIVYTPVTLAEAPILALDRTWFVVDISLTGVWRMVSRQADASQLSGPVGIAAVSQQAAAHGFYELISLVAFISVSLGLINLFPIPLLDGGHLLYYGCEAVLGRPLTERTQEVGFRLGLALVISLMIFAAWNDLTR
ncbi:MAG: RIP metalloprotease RseP [Rhizomicrobium sp.]